MRARRMRSGLLRGGPGRGAQAAAHHEYPRASGRRTARTPETEAWRFQLARVGRW